MRVASLGLVHSPTGDEGGCPLARDARLPRSSKSVAGACLSDHGVNMTGRTWRDGLQPRSTSLGGRVYSHVAGPRRLSTRSNDVRWLCCDPLSRPQSCAPHHERPCSHALPTRHAAVVSLKGGDVKCRILCATVAPRDHLDSRLSHCRSLNDVHRPQSSPTKNRLRIRTCARPAGTGSLTTSPTTRLLSDRSQRYIRSAGLAIQRGRRLS